MDEVCDENDKISNPFNVLSFERKLVELVEELRMRRNLESESEKTLDSVMDEKYKGELCWDEQKRRLTREKDYLEQQIELLKRKLEDKFCVSDDKAKLQIVNKTYSQEIKALKNELRIAKTEAFNYQKTIQEAESKLSLHNKFQESIMSQVSEVQNNMKSLNQERQELASAQKSLMENVVKTKSLFQKYNICNQHLQQTLTIARQKNEALEKELILQKTELTIIKSAVAEENGKKDTYQETEELQHKILELDQLLLLSRKENEETLKNFLESNKLLCQSMDKYSELQQRERTSSRDLEQCRDLLKETEMKLQRAQDEVRAIQSMEIGVSVSTQTEGIFNDDCVQHLDIPTAPDFVEALRNDLVELQKSAVIRQSEIRKNSLNNDPEEMAKNETEDASVL